ncbi:class I SAM-dependent methyltransferase [Actinopolyspora erythraea]|uniref:SAM-dependent methyltransferase n=1 Tax=Actinopolyspora erythraea TaxID=414996 RepID=A0A099D459_9ACTN|nr:class I SAM-dependent methyltransferase [Actinopolyspora erythraea]AIS23786.1 TDP-desosamine-N-dimethyltransferase [Actinopolyspora erythraea]ASU79086.1 class I SAM-dependent methyltransferase [Actinopolyspora erythraea]KGI80577.1 SAM-dependent methyltransferase [Actinopolyspora erythraea]
MYEGAFAELYDRFYRGRGKDYASEAAQVARLVRDRRPSASSLLDVACGTGAHLRRFADVFDDVTGLELSAAMIELARPQLDGIPVLQGDMRGFALDREFDAVTCMFSSIGHMRDSAELERALASFAHHLAPGGVVVVEPWWFPEDFLDGYVAGDVVRDGDLTISRVSHSVRAGDTTRMEIHWVVADPVNGPRHQVEHYEITLFERQQYEKAFIAAGCSVEYLADGPSGRGLFIGVRR